MANRLGPAPTAAAGTGCQGCPYARAGRVRRQSVALFDDSDGTSKREALRQWHIWAPCGPLRGKLLERELSSDRLDTPVKLAFDGYPRDMVSRAQVFAKLIAAEGVTVEKALEIAGLAGAE